jgi:flagellar hook-associated protein 2
MTSSTGALPPITSLGIGSNLDLQGILDSLQDNDEQVLTVITNQEASATSEISAFATLKSDLANLQTAAKAFATSGTGLKATVTGTGVSAAVDANATLTPNTYTVNVTQLATQQTLQSSAVTDAGSNIGTGGTITVTLANGKSENIAVGSDSSLTGVAKSINADANAGVTAQVINDGKGNSYLMLTAKNTGTQAAVSNISVSGNSALQGVLGYDASGATTSNMTETAQGQDAQLTINNISVTSGSNTVDSAIDGLTLSLTDTTDKPVTVTVGANTAGESGDVQNFVNAYNQLMTDIGSATAFDTTDNQASPLTGDATTAQIRSMMQNALEEVTGGKSITSLASMGISTDPDKGGQLDLDADDLSDAILTSPTDVQQILSSLGTQFGNALTDILGDPSDPTGNPGMITQAVNGLNDQISTLKDRYDSQNDEITAEIANMRAQFVALDTYVAQMNNTSTYLTQQFAALSGSSSSSKS